jgi:hypothetical protein
MDDLKRRLRGDLSVAENRGHDTVTVRCRDLRALLAEAEPARLDADRTAKPKTKLVAHVPLDGNCHNPSDHIDEIRDVREESHDEYMTRKHGQPSRLDRGPRLTTRP